MEQSNQVDLLKNFKAGMNCGARIQYHPSQIDGLKEKGGEPSHDQERLMKSMHD